MSEIRDSAASIPPLVEVAFFIHTGADFILVPVHFGLKTFTTSDFHLEGLTDEGCRCCSFL